MKRPRQYTRDEVQDLFLRHISNMVDYWLKESRAETTEEKLEGLAFSILTAIDGQSCALPGFILAPNPHHSDGPYHKSHGENWFPRNTTEDVVACDIGGDLHGNWHKVRHRRKEETVG